MVKVFKILFLYAYRVCAFFGMLSILVLIGQQLHLLSVPGQVDPRSSLFSLTHKQLEKYALEKVLRNNQPYTETQTPEKTLCKIVILSSNYPISGSRIYTTFTSTKDLFLIESQLKASTTNDTALLKKFQDCDSYQVQNETNNSGQDIFKWISSPEWLVLRSALSEDAEIIQSVSKELNINPRILITPIIGEQLRFFTSNRASFKRYFEPLKLFGSLSKFSFGIAGIKAETAERIEQNLKNKSSAFYLGEDYENLLDYPENVDKDSERLNRITNTKDHRYVYLYVGLYLKQLSAQWQSQGYNISNRPEILSTLYNLGHNRSIPKENPSAGGAPITIENKEYTFGGLAYDFYWSGELQELFPYKTIKEKEAIGIQ